MKKRVGVLMGGPSCERDISIRSGKAVCRALETKGISVVPLELEKVSAIDGYEKFVEDLIRSSNIELAFLSLHGKFGEDGKIQQILEGMNIPYTGSRVAASKLGMDKISAKHVFKLNNIPIPDYRVIDKDKLEDLFNGEVYFKEMKRPVVIKPCDEGSSIGLSIVDSIDALRKGIDNAFLYSDRVIVEQYVRGRELTVGILDDEALPVVEIVPKRTFFDFEAKYEKGLTEYVVPARLLDEEQYTMCQDIARKAHRSLGARFFSRVDMILSENGTPMVLEVNTIPGLTETSLLPKAALAAGIGFEELVLKILESASW